MVTTMEADTSSDQRPVIQASEILAKIERGEDVEYDGVIVEGDLDISGLELQTEQVDRTANEPIYLTVEGDLEADNYIIRDYKLPNELKVIRSQIIITNSEIQGEVKLDNVYFKDAIIFDGSKLTGGYASFVGAKISYGASFLGTKFTGNEFFMQSEFDGNGNFSDAEFCGPTSFDGTKSSNIIFDGAKFTGDSTSFKKVSGYLEFKNAEFNAEYTIFDDAKLYLNSNRARFNGEKVSFDRTKFYMGRFHKTKFAGDVSFAEAEFTQDADFCEAEFSGIAYFGGGFELSWDGGTAKVKLRGGAEFNGCADFKGAKLTSGYADFRGAKFDNKLILDEFKFEKLYITWDSIKDKLVYSGPVYLELIKKIQRY